MINGLFAFFDIVLVMLEYFAWVIVGFGLGLFVLVHCDHQWKKESEQQSKAHEEQLQEMQRVFQFERERAISAEQKYVQIHKVKKESDNNYHCRISFLEQQIDRLNAELRHAREKGKRLAKKTQRCGIIF